MRFLEVDLPGIGKKFSLTTSDGNKITVVIHLSGKREIFIFEEDDEEPMGDIILNEDEAGQLGSILMGTYFKPEEDNNKELLLQQNLAIDWFRIKKDSPLIGKSIKELAIKTITGATIVSIIRKDYNIINPNANEILEEGDILVLMGKREELDSFMKKYNLE